MRLGGSIFAFEAALDARHETIIQVALEYEPHLRHSELRDGSEGDCSAGGGLSLLPDDPRAAARRNYRYGRDGASKNEESGNVSSKFNGRLLWTEPEEGVQRSKSFSSAVKRKSDINEGNGRFLRIAARHNYLNIIKHRIDQGFDMNTTGNFRGSSSGQSTQIEVAAAAGQMHAIELLPEKGAKVGKALSYAVRNQNEKLIRLLSQKRPGISVDEPVRQNSGGYYKSPVSVAVAWNLSHTLNILLDRAKQRCDPPIGQGLVVAVRRRNSDLLHSILNGFELEVAKDRGSAAYKHYKAFFSGDQRGSAKQRHDHYASSIGPYDRRVDEGAAYR